MLSLFQEAQRQAEPLSTGGWIMMILSVVSIVWLMQA